MISILIPSRTVEYLERALTALVSSHHYRSSRWARRRIIVGDNGLAAHPWHHAVTYVPVPQPFNFAQAINLCAAAAHPEDDLLVLNDDARPMQPSFPLWAEHVAYWGYRRGFGLISPRIDGGVGNDDQRVKTEVDVYRQTYRPICFMAAIIPRPVWDQVGSMDERFTGYGFDDADYSRRVVEAGYKLGVAGWFSVEHGINGMVQSATFGRVFDHATYSEMGQRALRIFSDKWGTGPQLGMYELNRKGA